MDACYFDEPIVAVAFYGSGNVDLAVKYGEKQKDFHYIKGLSFAFYADEKVEFEHTISPEKSLKCIVVATKMSKLEALEYPNKERLLNSRKSYSA